MAAMSKREVVHTAKAPAALGPYSQAIASNGFVFCSGQIGIDPDTGQVVEGVEAQTRQVLRNLEAVLHAANSSLSRAVKTTIYLADLASFEVVNACYAEHFHDAPPARATVEVSRLPLDVLVEMDVIAVVDTTA